MTPLRPPVRNASGIWALTALLAAATPLAVQGAQQGLPAPLDYDSPLQGVVVDESTFQPIEGATVTIVGTELVTETDAYGSFAFPDPPAGFLSIRAAAPDRVSATEEVVRDEGRLLHVQFMLPRVDEVLAGILVGVQPGATGGDPATAADMVARRVPGLLFGPAGVGDVDRDILLRGINSFGDGGSPHLFVDGVRVTGSSIYDVLSRIPAEEVDRIEVLRGPNQAFRHQYAADGVIHVYTK